MTLLKTVKKNYAHAKGKGGQFLYENWFLVQIDGKWMETDLRPSRGKYLVFFSKQSRTDFLSRNGKDIH